LVPSLAALISHARLWIVDGKTTAAGVEFLAAIQRLLLHLLRCRPGLLFIGADKKAATAITDGLRLMQNVQEMDILPFHHVAVLTSVGLLCRPCDLAGMLQSSISVVGFSILPVLSKY
jgi:ABC-type dipeptide/oligopeptide/nickel transport system ATPase subunit